MPLIDVYKMKEGCEQLSITFGEDGCFSLIETTSQYNALLLCSLQNAVPTFIE